MKKTYVPRGNEWVSTSQIDNLWEFIKSVSNYTVDQNGLLCAFIFSYLICLLLRYHSLTCDLPNPDKAGRNMSIIPIVDKIRSLLIQINRQISEIDKSRSHNFLWLSTLFDYDWFWSTLIDFDRFQSTNTKSEIQKTMYGGKKEYSCRGQINKAALAAKTSFYRSCTVILL